MQAIFWALRQRVFWALVAAFTIYYGTLSGLAYHLYALLLEWKMKPSATVAVMALLGPAQVAGRMLVWAAARKRTMPEIGRLVVPAFPVAVLMLLVFPHAAGAVLFIVIFGMANGIMTVIRGTAVPVMLTRHAYGSINSAIAIPANVAKATAPFLIAFLWTFNRSYDAALFVVLAASVIVVAAVWYATGQCTIRDAQADAVSGRMEAGIAT